MIGEAQQRKKLYRVSGRVYRAPYMVQIGDSQTSLMDQSLLSA